MSLYEQALIEAKKLKEVAEEDAKKAIVEEITPFIRKMISNQIAGKSSPLFEEADLSLPGTEPAPEQPSEAVPVSPPAVVGGPLDAPIKASGADALNILPPDEEGLITVNLNDIWTPAQPGDDMAKGDENSGSAEVPPEMPAGMPTTEPVDVNPAPGVDASSPAPVEELPPAPEGPTPQLETIEMFREELEKTALKVNQAYSSKNGVPSLMKEALQEKLFFLLESLTNIALKDSSTLPIAKIFENRLEILHLKLKEAKLGNTYNRTEKKDPETMASKSLKEFASKMLAESDTVKGGDVTSPADSFKKTVPMKASTLAAQDATPNKAGAHAMKMSEPTVTLKTEAAELAKLEEELKSLLSESEGDSLSAEEGGQDLAGAASSIPDEKVGQVDTTKSTSSSSSNPASYVQSVSENMEHSEDEDEEEMKKESVAVSKKDLAEQTSKLRKENLKRKIRALQEQLAECGMEEEGMSGGVSGAMEPMEEETVTLPVELSFDTMDLKDLIPGMGDDGDMDDDTVLDVVDDSPSDGQSDEDSGMDSDDDSDDDTFEVDMDSDDSDSDDDDKMSHLAESVKRGLGPMASKALRENKALKLQLAEQQLFNAKVVNFQPFMNNKNLSKEQKQKIVEFLDRGTTTEEVKAIYNKIKLVLETKQKAIAKAGSSSKASSSRSLNESANPFEGASLVESEKARLMKLAGIKTK